MNVAVNLAKLPFSKLSGNFRDALWAQMVDAIEDETLKAAAPLAQKVALGTFNIGEKSKAANTIDSEALAALNLTPQQAKDVIKLATHFQRSSNAMESILLNALGIPEKQLEATLDRLVDGYKIPMEGVLDVINSVEIVKVITAHPTYNGAPEYSDAIRGLFSAVEDKILKGQDITPEDLNNDTIKTAIKKLYAAQTVPETKYAVADEVDNGNRQISTDYDATRQSLLMLHRALQKKFGDKYNPRTMLKLPYDVKGWYDSSDGDGNSEIIYDTTAEALTKKRHAIVNKYLDELVTFRDITVGVLSEEERNSVYVLMEKMSAVRDGDPMAADVSERLAEANAEMQKFFDRFQTDEFAAKHPQIAEHVMMFEKMHQRHGLHFVKHEFRNTAENRKEVLGKFIPDDVVLELKGDVFTEEAITRIKENKISAYEALADAKNLKPEYITDEKIPALLANEKRSGDEDLDLSLRVEKLTGKMRGELLDAITEKHGTAAYKQWQQEAMQALETHMETMSEEERLKITGPGYKHEYSRFYHDIKRELLMQNNPDMRDSMVLAEATEPAHYKEQLAILRATGNENTRIILLFEEPNVLKKGEIGKRIQAMLDDKEIFQHLVELGIKDFEKHTPEYKNDPEYQKIITELRGITNGDKDKKIELNARLLKLTNGKFGLEQLVTLEVQFAHSDNRRKGSPIAATGILYEAQKEIEEVCNKNLIGSKRYQGFSVTDAFRGGTRVLDASFKLFNTLFAKFTSQHIDGELNYSTISNAINNFTNLFTEMVSYAAVKTASYLRYGRGHAAPSDTADYKIEDWNEIPNPPLANEKGNISSIHSKFNLGEPLAEAAQTKHADRLKANKMKKILDGNQMADAKNKAAYDVKESYEKEFYFTEIASFVMGQIFAPSADSVSSRSASRSGKVDTNKIYPTKIRTIAFSHAFQDEQVHPLIMGSGEYLDVMLDEKNGLVAKIRDTINGNKANFEHITGKNIDEINDEKLMQMFYQYSPDVRYMIDQMGYGVAATNMDRMWEKAMKKTVKLDGDETENISANVGGKRPDQETLIRLINERYYENGNLVPSKFTVTNELAYIEMQYQKSEELVKIAMTGEPLTAQEAASSKAMQQAIRPLLNETYHGHFEKLDAYFAFKDTMGEILGSAFDKEAKRLLKLGTDFFNYAVNLGKFTLEAMTEKYAGTSVIGLGE